MFPFTGSRKRSLFQHSSFPMLSLLAISMYNFLAVAMRALGIFSTLSSIL